MSFRKRRRKASDDFSGAVQGFPCYHSDYLAIISGFLGDAESAAVILIVITINAILGTVQTVKAEKSLNSLKKLSGPEAKVERDGTVMQIPSREVTVGDIVILEAGDQVPADGRIIEQASLKVDESALTGESIPVEKSIDLIEGEVPLGDRVNMVFSGSFVTYGRGKFVVTGIGMETEVGKIASLLKTTSEKRTPLQVNLDQFGQKLSILILILCAILMGINVWRGESFGDAFMFAVALAVAAIPEALSSIVTIVLSFGTQKMAREHAIIRKLQAVEGLGSVSVICSDKTGTLTQNKMTVEDYYIAGHRMSKEEVSTEQDEVRRLMLASILCNDAKNVNGQEIGDPTETALVTFAGNCGMDVEEIRQNMEESRKCHLTVTESSCLPYMRRVRVLSCLSKALWMFFLEECAKYAEMVRKSRSQMRTGSTLPVSIRISPDRDLEFSDLHIRDWRQRQRL